MSVQLRAMTRDEYAAWLPGAVAHYASLNAAAQGISDTEAQQQAEKQFAELLAQGVETPEHHVLVAGNGTRRVGMLWLWLKGRTDGVHAFVYDIVVEPDCRGQGFGRAIMEAAEDYAHQHHAVRIGLHVHASNTVACALYEHLDYETTDLVMSKSLSKSKSQSQSKSQSLSGPLSGPAQQAAE